MNDLLEKIKTLDDQSKKLIKKASIILFGIIIFIIVISIVISIINRKTSYIQMESIMEKAAYNYYQDNLSQLPSADVKTSIVSVQTLIDKEYMKKSIEKYTKDASCTGNVIVTYINDDYDYQAYLTCNSFKTELLVDKIKSDNPLVTSDAGLYDEEGLLRFRGEKVNNYLKIEDELYRIVKIDAENKIYITPEDMDDNSDLLNVIWDDRYNTEQDNGSGINSYNLSRINDSLNNIYNSFSNTLKSYITTYSTCIAKRANDDTNNTGSTECSEKNDNRYIGLFPLYEYIKASIAPACNSALTKECKNYNYLVMKDNRWWTSTGRTDDTKSVYYISGSGEIDKDSANNRRLARYVLALKANTILKDGTGTNDKPYQIR